MPRERPKEIAKRQKKEQVWEGPCRPAPLVSRRVHTMQSPRTNQPRFQHCVNQSEGSSCPWPPSSLTPACSGSQATLLQHRSTRESARRLWGSLAYTVPVTKLRVPRLLLPSYHCYVSVQAVSEPPASFPPVIECTPLKQFHLPTRHLSGLSASPSSTRSMLRIFFFNLRICLIKKQSAYRDFPQLQKQNRSFHCGSVVNESD